MSTTSWFSLPPGSRPPKVRMKTDWRSWNWCGYNICHIDQNTEPMTVPSPLHPSRGNHSQSDDQKVAGWSENQRKGLKWIIKAADRESLKHLSHTDRASLVNGAKIPEPMDSCSTWISTVRVCPWNLPLTVLPASLLMTHSCFRNLNLFTKAAVKFWKPKSPVCSISSGQDSFSSIAFLS